MGILITNDDGIDNIGIKLLIEAVKDIDDIYICAPKKEQSAKSHSITIYQDINIEKRAPNIYAVEGTPSDCVRVGLQALWEDKIDLVVSGINSGMNIGIDTYYSGTVGAAREGVINSVHSLAYSYEYHTGAKNDMSYAALTAKTMTEKIYALIKSGKIKKSSSFKDALFLNINVPQEKPIGTRFTTITDFLYKDAHTITEINDKDKKITFKPTKPRTEKNTGSDLSALIEGCISVTPMSISLEKPFYTDTFLKEVLL